MNSDLKENLNTYFNYIFCKDIMPLFIIPSDIDHLVLEKLQIQESKLKKIQNSKININIKKIKNSNSYKFMKHRQIAIDNYLNLFKKKILIVIKNFNEELQKINLIDEIKTIINNKYNFKNITINEIDNINEYFCINFANALFDYHKDDNDKFKLRNKFIRLIKLMKKLI